MQYTYRGISYTGSSQSRDTIETETSAKYRGTSYRIRRPIESSPSLQPNLKYRGVAYFYQAKSGEIKTLPIFS